MVSGRNILTKQDKKIIFIRQISHNADRDNRMKKKKYTMQLSDISGINRIRWIRRRLAQKYSEQKLRLWCGSN